MTFKLEMKKVIANIEQFIKYEYAQTNAIKLNQEFIHN